MAKDDRLARYRRCRGGRTLPRSGGGRHKDTRRHLQEEADAMDWKRDLDNWLTNAPDPGEEVECPDCGDDGGPPNPDCDTCDGTGWVGEDALKMQDYERAEAERAEEWRKE